MTWLALLAAACGIGFGCGAIFMGWAFGTQSHDIWEITTPQRGTYYLTDVREVEAALRVDGLAKVRRRRVFA